MTKHDQAPQNSREHLIISAPQLHQLVGATGTKSIDRHVVARATTYRRDGSQRAPGTLELVQVRQQGEKLGRDLYCVDVDHTGIYTGIDRIIKPNTYRNRPD